MLSETSLRLFRDQELIGILILCMVCTAVSFLISLLFPKKQSAYTAETSALSFLKPVRKPVWGRHDTAAVLILTSVTAVITFMKLGTSVFPETTWQPQEAGQSFVLELKNDTHTDAVYTIYGEGFSPDTDYYQIGTSDISLYGSNDGITWDHFLTLEDNGIYHYGIYPCDADYRYIRISSGRISSSLTEIAFRKAGTDSFLPVSVFEDEYAGTAYPASLVIDEQNKLTADPTYYEEGYFDEVYHPRNAWEIANGQYLYATVHPLFGTNLIALSIKMFGMNPFAWRLPGAVFGVLIIPLMYAVLKNVFCKPFYCMFGTALTAFDFMHMTTSRIGTLEPFSIFFILLMYYYMIRFFRGSFYITPFRKQMFYLFLSGIFMGIGIAVKWTACYSAVGLAVLLFTNLWMRFLEYRRAGKEESLNNSEYSQEQLAEIQRVKNCFPRYFLYTILLCFLFFILIPAVIYWVSYLPDRVWTDGWSVGHVWEQNIRMYRYHTELTAEHPFQSSWYQWLLDLRPIWYYVHTENSGIMHTISCFSNPLLTWAGLPAIIYTICRTVKEKDPAGWIILTGYFTALMPWVSFVQRCVFAYHFYPTSIFTAAAVTYAAYHLRRKDPGRRLTIAFLAAYILMFIIFMPVITGFGTSQGYVRLLEWLPGWYFG